VRVQSQGGRSNPPTAATPHHPRHPHQHPHPHPHQHPHSHSVPQLAEEDYCPICHRALPYLRDPSDTGREAHIASCIAAATSPSPPFPAAVGRSRSYTNGGRMVVWNADPMDCRDPATGDRVECVICFEEFDVGCEIARLECLCRYHKVHAPPPCGTVAGALANAPQKCIRDWFDRKGNGECPTHAIHE
jgi:hypothetical protein